MYKCPICGLQCGREHGNRKILQHLVVSMDTQGHVHVHRESPLDRDLLEIMIDTVIDMLQLRSYPKASERYAQYQKLYQEYKLDRSLGDIQWLEKLKKARTMSRVGDASSLRELIGA